MEGDRAGIGRLVLEGAAAVDVVRVELTVVRGDVWANPSSFLNVTVSPTFTVISVGL